METYKEVKVGLGDIDDSDDIYTDINFANANK